MKEKSSIIRKYKKNKKIRKKKNKIKKEPFSTILSDGIYIQFIFPINKSINPCSNSVFYFYLFYLSIFDLLNIFFLFSNSLR